MMPETISKGDFIELHYTGKVADSEEVFDTTVDAVAKEHELDLQGSTFAPVVVQLGKSHLLAGLDRQLEGKNVGEHYAFAINAEEGFGKRNAKLIQLVSTAKFRSQKIQPVPGLELNIDGMRGRVRTVTGGRTIVDFNHPLAGKKLSYDVKVLRKVTDPKEQLDSYLKVIGLESETTVTDGIAVLTTRQDFPAEVREKLSEGIQASISTINEVTFTKSVDPGSKGIATKEAGDPRAGTTEHR